MKKIVKVVAFVFIMATMLSFAMAADPQEITASNNWSISSADYSGSFDTAEFKIHTSKEIWNDWCPIFLKVTTDGVDTYYVWAGAQVNWAVTVGYEDPDCEDNLVVPAGGDASTLKKKDGTAVENYKWATIATDATETISVDLKKASEWKITFYSPAWTDDTLDPVQDDPDGTTKDLASQQIDGFDSISEPYVVKVLAATLKGDSDVTVIEDAAAEEPKDSAETTPEPTAAPATDTKTETKNETKTTTTDKATKTGDATSVAVLAVVALISLAGVVVTRKHA